MALTRRPAGAAALLLAFAAAGRVTAAAEIDPHLSRIAAEARQTIAVIEWFYVQHRACPQPSRLDELEDLQRGLGDGFSVERQGQFVVIRGISMTAAWLYYTSPTHPDRCTLWRKLGWDPALIWRRAGGSAEWVYDPGDGGSERRLSLNP